MFPNRAPELACDCACVAIATKKIGHKKDEKRARSFSRTSEDAREIPLIFGCGFSVFSDWGEREDLGLSLNSK
jgi:hypothetical protein